MSPPRKPFANDSASKRNGLRTMSSRQRRKLRLRIWEEQRGVCNLCAEYVEFAECEIDHCIAVAHWPPDARKLCNHRSNLQMLCHPCNKKKGAR